MNPFMERVMAGERISPEEMPALHEGLQAFEIPYCITGVSAPCGKG